MQTLQAEEAANMTTYVLVHGAYHGGWCWRDVARDLRTRGHEAFTPTLTGLGERKHLISPAVNLSTHIEDVAAVLEWEDLRDVVLVGHSYGGMVTTGVADRLPHRIADMVYLDATVPKDGQSVLDVQPPGRAAWMADRARAAGGLAAPPVEADVYGVIEPAQKAWVDGKCTPQPFATLSQKLRLSGAPADRIARRLYILCTDPALPYMQGFHDWAEAEGWDVAQMETGHDAMVTEPAALAEILAARG